MSIFWLVTFTFGWISSATPKIDHTNKVQRQLIVVNALGQWQTITWEEQTSEFVTPR